MACTRLSTARFFRGYAPAKTLVSVASLAGPAAGEAEALDGLQKRCANIAFFRWHE